MSGEIVFDRPSPARRTGRTVLHAGFRTLARHDIVLAGHDGRPIRQTRELLEIGEVACVLPYDPVRDRLVLIRQYRAGADVAWGNGSCVEIVAGLVDPGETPEEAARRELREEAGLGATRLEPMLAFMPSPGITTERAHLYFAEIDSAALPATAGDGGEGEIIEPFAVDPDAAIAAALEGRIVQAHTLVALFWFAARRRGLAGDPA